MDRKIIEAKVDEVLSANDKKAATTKQQNQADNPFAGGMPGMENNPFAAFGAADFSNMAGMAKPPLKIRIAAKVAGMATNPKFKRFLNKRWWPLWLVVGIIFFAFALVIGLFFLVWKLLKALASPYTELFKKK